jgi:hypothetical protein
MRHKSNAGPAKPPLPSARALRQQAIINGVLLQSGGFTQYFRLHRIFARFG